MRETILARVYGSANACGKVRKFYIMDVLPEGSERVRLDPEQRVGKGDDEDNQWRYGFYRTDEGRYVAVEENFEEEE